LTRALVLLAWTAAVALPRRGRRLSWHPSHSGFAPPPHQGHPLALHWHSTYCARCTHNFQEHVPGRMVSTRRGVGTGAPQVPGCSRRFCVGKILPARSQCLLPPRTSTLTLQKLDTAKINAKQRGHYSEVGQRIAHEKVVGRAQPYRNRCCLLLLALLFNLCWLPLLDTVTMPSFLQ
jgi:hypothetical protein